jgi:DNA helicase-2/ATP-dependent DNA helicase PcrA
MNPPEIDLISSDKGLVVAPAGCGKTQIIIDSLIAHPDQAKPVLILTHTNAGVAALRNRLNAKGVKSTSYKVSTIDGWSMRLVSMFPKISGCSAEILKIKNPSKDYQSIRNGALKILSSGNLDEALKATYSKLLADEYQDCQIIQHQIISKISDQISTCVVGDPLQAIFNFGSNQLVSWSEVTETFPIIGELKTPWRWINAGVPELGEWLISIRPKLLTGKRLDLENCPRQVKWIRVDPKNSYAERLNAASTKPTHVEGQTLVLGDSSSPPNQQKIASQTPGATTVESADFRDLIAFSSTFIFSAPNALERLVNFCSTLVANVNAADFLRRIASLQNARVRTEANETEKLALEFIKDPSLYAASLVLDRISSGSGCRIYRPEILKTAINAMQLADQGPMDFFSAVLYYRDLSRHLGKRINKRAVGSTLLLKGLEADTVVILHPEKMDAANLYVALTRGAKAIVICSESRCLPV